MCAELLFAEKWRPTKAIGRHFSAKPDPVVAVLSPETVLRNDIVLHQLEEKCRTNTFSVLHLISSDPSTELGPLYIEGLPICPQDTRMMISDGRWGDDMFCLLIFSSPGNAVSFPVVGRPDFKGTGSWTGHCLGPRYCWFTSPAPVL